MNRLFDEYDDEDKNEYLNFEAVENKRSSARDLHAFLLLHELVPAKNKIIRDAEHDEIYLGVDKGDLCKVITTDQILELVRCGVRLSGVGLSMFV